MTSPVVRRIDHLIIRADGKAYEKLWALFGNTFGLPRPWPPSEHPAFTSAGVFAGNVDFELLKIHRRGSDAPPRARLYGIVFEANSPFDAIQKDLQELRSRRVPYLPMPYVARENQSAPTTYWHNIFLGNLISQNRWMNLIFFYKRLHPDRLWMSMMSRGNSNNPAAARFMFDTVYSEGIVFAVKYNSSWRDIDKERSQSDREFRQAGGGGLGLVRVRSIQVGVKEFPYRKDLWGSLFAPYEPIGPATWQAGSGPAVELMPSDDVGIQSMTWEVRDLVRSKSFLEQQSIGYTLVNDELHIDQDDLYGLNIRLVEGS